MKRILFIILCLLVVPSFALAGECLEIDHDDGMTYTFCYEVDRGDTNPPTVKLVFKKMEPTIEAQSGYGVTFSSVIPYGVVDEGVITWDTEKNDLGWGATE